LSPPISDSDLATIAERLLVDLYQVPEIGRVRGLVADIQADGRWADVDYANMDTTHWKPIGHLRNLLLMAQAWRTEGSELKGDNDLEEAIFRALDHWLEKDYRRPWWYNAIGIPGVLANVMLLIDADLDDSRRELGCKILERAILGTTGQNLVWQANITVKRAILQRDPDLAAEAYKLIASEIKISTGEGVQPDFSFHQHGPCLYNHGYGAGFARDCSKTAVLVSGTHFAFPKKQVDILAGYILDGSQWMIRGQNPEIGAKGREITRANLNVLYLVDAARNMAVACPERADAFEALAVSIESGTAPPMEGNRSFWCSDFMAHHRKAFYASARAHSSRIVNTDGLSGCDEGQKSHHISDGASFVYRTGREYADIFPVWDWRKIPGTTVVLGPDFAGDPKRLGTTDFVGGVSDGVYGLFVCDLVREASPLDQVQPPRKDDPPPEADAPSPDTLRARKAWFFFDDEVVCLGAGISVSGEGRDPAVTTLNQCLLNGPIAAADGSGGCDELASGNHVLQDAAWVHHDGIAYVFYDPQTVHIDAAPRTGSWDLIATQASDAPVTKDVFTVWVDHGPHPRAETYAYVAVPGVESGDVQAYADSLPVQVLANTPQVQAVQHLENSLTLAAFYEPGVLALPDGLTIGVDTACLVLLHTDDSGCTLTFSNPRNEPVTIGVEINGSFGGPSVETTETGSRVTVSLPNGWDAGKSVTVALLAAG
jgi:chondroitin AC lyase